MLSVAWGCLKLKHGVRSYGFVMVAEYRAPRATVLHVARYLSSTKRNPWMNVNHYSQADFAMDNLGGDVREENGQTRTLTSVDRIRQLNSIDQSILNLLHSAGQAFSALTTLQAARGDIGGGQADIQFENHTKTFFDELKSVQARITRSKYALYEAGLVRDPIDIEREQAALKIRAQAEAQARYMAQTYQGQASRRGFRGGTTTAEEYLPITNGGLGNLDIGWLNARAEARDVGRKFQEELWKEARRVFQDELENMGIEAQVVRKSEAGREDGAIDKGSEGQDNDDQMNTEPFEILKTET